LLEALGLRNVLAVPMRVIRSPGVLLMGNRDSEAIKGAAVYSSYDARMATVTTLFLELLIETDDLAVRHRELFELIPSGVFLADPEGRLVECNQAFTKLLGVRDKPGIKGRNLDELVLQNEKDNREFFRLLDEPSEGSAAFLETPCRLEDGTRKLFSVFGHRVEHRGETRWIEGTVRDVTEESAWKAVAEETLKSQGMTAFYVIERDEQDVFRFLVVSPGTDRILGYDGSSEDTARGIDIQHVVGEESWPAVHDILKKKWRGASSRRHSFAIKLPNNGIGWVEAESHLGVYQSRKAILGYMRDVTVEQWRTGAIETLTKKHLAMPDFLDPTDLCSAYEELGELVLGVQVRVKQFPSGTGEFPSARALRITPTLQERSRTYIEVLQRPEHGWEEESPNVQEVISLFKRQFESSIRLFHEHRVLLMSLRKCVEVKKEEDIEALVNAPLTKQALGSPDLILYYPYEPSASRFSTPPRVIESGQLELPREVRLDLVNEGGVADYVRRHGPVFRSGQQSIYQFIDEHLDKRQAKITLGLVKGVDDLNSVVILPLTARGKIFGTDRIRPLLLYSSGVMAQVSRWIRSAVRAGEWRSAQLARSLGG